MTDEQIQEAVIGVGEAMQRELGGADFQVVDSATWYRDQFPASGSWDTWIWESVNGKDYKTRAPHFRGFVVCSSRLGRANSEIVRLALRAGRAVLSWRASGQLRIVEAVRAENPNDWKSGWSVETKEIT